MPNLLHKSLLDLFKTPSEQVKKEYSIAPEADIKSKDQEFYSKLVVESDVYNKEALYFTRKEDIGRVSKENPGQKFNKGHIDSMIISANEAVQKKLISPQGADYFIANQLREARLDFGLRPDKTTINLTEGKTRDAAKAFFPNINFDNIKPEDFQALTSYVHGDNPDPYLLLLPSNKNKEPNKLRYKAVGNGRYLNEDPNSPYRDTSLHPNQDEITYNDFIVNGKIAMIKYLSKYGKNMKDEDVVKAWNGKGSKAEEHSRQVFSNLEALKDPTNKVISNYISERINYEGSTYKK